MCVSVFMLAKFIQGNKEKRQRAAERLHEDIKTVKKTKAHIEQLKKDYADLEEIKLLFDKEIAAHRLYQVLTWQRQFFLLVYFSNCRNICIKQWS